MTMTTFGEVGGADAAGLAAVRARLVVFRAGGAAWSALDLYRALEICTPLLRFHTMLRGGPQNRLRSGLQQSYGDHNRLLALGIDRLAAGDVDWYRARLAGDGEAGPGDLEACAAAVRGLGLGREALASLWVAAALHDYGMLSGRPGGVDVEDGVVLCGPILDALCDEPHRGLARFVVRNHDYVKDVFDGGVPPAFVARQREALAPALRPAALAALGIVQVAGAASLGEGRLTRARLGIFRRCVDGTALGDATAEARLARLLGHAHLDVPVGARAGAARLLADPRDGGALIALLDRALLHGWDRARSAVGREAGNGRADALLALLRAVAECWNASGGRHEHVVLGDGLGAWLARRAADDHAAPIAARPTRLHGGAGALTVHA
jgi:hypothetical protein